ncbi:hypothetical protein BDY24DRAFT_29354 [Mrakia frigida]|uniref:uncharacterized protein n=1 Tax=Mrakia frigida TaxID=29902 RepID=UPI003FCC1285
MPFSKLSKPLTTSVTVVPSQASMFDYRPKLVASSSSSSLLTTGHHRSTTPPPIERLPSFTSATFESSPEASSADPTPQTPFVETFPSNPHPEIPAGPNWPATVYSDAEDEQSQSFEVSVELPSTGEEEKASAGPIWKKEQDRQSNRFLLSADESFDSNASPSKSSYGYPDSILEHYGAPSDGGSPFVSHVKGGSKLNDESPAQQSFLSYSTHSPVSPTCILASPTSSEKARYLDRSISPSNSILEARRIETAVHDPSPSRSHLTSTSEDSEDSSHHGFASVHLAVRGTPAAPAFVPSSALQPSQTPSTHFHHASPLPTPGQAYRSVARSIGLPLNPSDYSNSPSNRDGSFNFESSSEASPTPLGVVPFDASFEAAHQRNLKALNQRLDDDSFVFSSSGGADIEEVDELVSGRGKGREDASKGKKPHQLSLMTKRAKQLVKKSSMPSISSPLAKGSGNVSSPAPSSLSSNSPSSLHYSPAFTPLPTTYTSAKAQRFAKRYAQANPASSSSKVGGGGDTSFGSDGMESELGKEIMRSARKARGVKVKKGGMGKREAER